MEKWNDFNQMDDVTISSPNLEDMKFDFVGIKKVKPVEKRRKIKSRRAYEHEINEESKRVVTNTFAVGLTSLASIICFSSLGIESLDLSRRIGMVLLGTLSTKGIYSSVKILNESIARKAKLEDAYNINYKLDEHTNEETRGRSI